MYRAYHAIRGLSGPDGKSTNAVYGFVTMLRKLLADHEPEYIAASFDLAGPTFRDQLATDYKANRTPMPDDLAEQIAWVHDACEAMGVPIYTAHGFEADDVIGTLALRAAASGLDVVIVTGDKDFFQLVGGPIRVFNPRDEGAWYDPDGVQEKFGVRPDQVVDVLALMGDSIDNIKGVPGIGEKGARELIVDARIARRAAGARSRRAAEAVSRGAAGQRRRRATQPRTAAHPHRRARRRRRQDLRVPGPVAAAVLRPVQPARLPHAVDGVRADGRDGRQVVHAGDDRRRPRDVDRDNPHSGPHRPAYRVRWGLAPARACHWRRRRHVAAHGLVCPGVPTDRFAARLGRRARTRDGAGRARSRAR